MKKWRVHLSIMAFILITVAFVFSGYSFAGDSRAVTNRYKIKGLSIEIPEDYTVLTRMTSPGELLESGIGISYEDIQKHFDENAIYLDFFSEKFNDEIVLFIEDSPIIDYYAWTDDELKEIIKAYSDIYKDQGFSLVDYEIIKSEQALYLKSEYVGAENFVFLQTIHNKKNVLLRLGSLNGQSLSNDQKRNFTDIGTNITYAFSFNRYDIFCILILLLFGYIIFSFPFYIIKTVKSRKTDSSTSVIDDFTDILHHFSSLQRFWNQLKNLLSRQWVSTCLFCLLMIAVNVINDERDAAAQYLAEKYDSYLVLFLIFIGLGGILTFARSIIDISQKITIKKKGNEEERVLQKQRNQEAAQIPPSKSILYLRPFHADANSVVSDHGSQYRKSRLKKISNSFGSVNYRGQKFTNFESIICKSLEGVGIPIAIGDPNEREAGDIPLMSAGRIYASDESWKTVVEEFFKESKIVILYVDFTDGVKWELNTAIQKYKDKVVFIPKLYNKHNRVLKNLAYFPLTAILFYPIYFFAVKLLLLPKLRRHCNYYREWENYFDFAISDKVCAVRFTDNGPLLYKTKFGSLEDQLGCIVNAIRNIKEQISGEKIICDKNSPTLLISMSRRNISTIQHQILPDGEIRFGSNGIIYRHVGWISRLTSFNIMYRFAYKPVFRQDISYSDIYSVKADEKFNTIEIITESINGAFYLVLPNNEKRYLSEISGYLNQRSHASEDYDINNDSQIKHISASIKADSIATCVIFVLAAILSVFNVNLLVSGLVFCVMGYVAARQTRIKWISVLTIIIEILIFIIAIVAIVSV